MKNLDPKGLVPLVLCGFLLTGCSLNRIVVNRVSATLAESSEVFASDEDPELVRAALPFALKTIEGLLLQDPENPGLLLSACSGFTQYSYAFVETDAFLLEDEDFRGARKQRRRALKLYLRGRDSCLKALELAAPGIRDRLLVEPETAVEALGAEDLDLIFWSAASWGAAISLGRDEPELTADLPVVRALLERGMELDESYSDGLLHQAMVPLAALPEAMGGSEEQARHHFRRAQELTGGRSAGAYVTLARTVAVARQDRREFVSLLEQALEVDVDEEPSQRLANLIAQQWAEELQTRVDDLFFEEEDFGEGEGQD